MTNNSCPRTAALWAKLTPARRIVLNTAYEILAYGESIATNGHINAGDSMRMADKLNDEIFSLRGSTLNLFEGSLTKHPEWTEVDLYRHVVGVVAGKEKIGDNLTTLEHLEQDQVT